MRSSPRRGRWHGEVYRARDPRLGREVAIKVLPAAFSADSSGRRFLVATEIAQEAPERPLAVIVNWTAILKK